MIISDFVECEGCGAAIAHIGPQGALDYARKHDLDYKLCLSCCNQRDEHSGVEREDDEATEVL